LLKKYKLPIRQQKACSRLCTTSFDHGDHLEAIEICDTVGFIRLNFLFPVDFGG